MQFWKPGTAAPGPLDPALVLPESATDASASRRSPGSTVDREAEAEGGLIIQGGSTGNFGSLGLQAQRQRLPIYKHRESHLRGRTQTSRHRFADTAAGQLALTGDHLLYALERYPILIVVGQTGCGKTTRDYWLWTRVRPLRPNRQCSTYFRTPPVPERVRVGC